MIMVAVEIGFGDVKVVGDGIKLKFPTVIAVNGNGMLKDWEDRKGYLYKRKNYLVGDEAFGHPEMFSSRDESFLIEYTPLFLYKVYRLLGRMPERVALGLPVGYYGKKQILKSQISSFEVNGERIEIKECEIFPQAAGIWFDWVGANSQRSEGSYMVVDVGFNTVDVVFTQGGKVVKAGSWMLEGEGIIKMVNHLSDLIQEKVGVSLIPHTAKKLLESKKLVIYGKERNLEKVIKKISEGYTERLFSVLKSRCGERFKDLKGVILGGGGAYYVRDFVPRSLKGLVEIVEEPEFANARGFYRNMARGGEI